MTAPVDSLMHRAIKARQRAQTAIGEAVREARAAGWSWEQMSWALGGSPSADALRRTFAGDAEEPGDRPGCAGGQGSCGCAGCG